MPLFSTPSSAASAPDDRFKDDRNDPLFGDHFLETLNYLQIVARKILSGQMKAQRRSRKKGVSVEFADHRPYAPGDDFRFIDWNIFRRNGHLFLKQFEEEEDLYIYLLVDCSDSMDYGMPYKFHMVRRLVAAMGYLGLASLDRIHVIPFSNTIPKQANDMLALRGRNKIFTLLQFLENLKPGGPTDIYQSMRLFANSKRKRGLAIILSDLYDEQKAEDAINLLRFQKYDVFVVHCISPQESNPELLGDIRLLDTETHRYRDVTLTESLLKRYNTHFENYCQRIEHFCRSKDMGYIRCSSATPFEETIIEMLRKERFLQ